MTPAPEIGLWQLALALVFVAAAGGASLWLKLGLGRDILVGTLRTFGQLALLGYVLVYIFKLRWPPLAVLCLAGMTFFAARIVAGRVKKWGIPIFNPVFGSMLLSYTVVTFVVVGLVVQADPWWLPRYFIPLGGMVVGNSMNAMALAIERLFADADAKRGQIETMLSLGADGREATAHLFASSVKAGMIPSINSMMGVGVVFIPGMMTGQILAGADPLAAIRYQIVVMVMLVGSTTLGSVLAVTLARRRLFDSRERLVLPEVE